MRELDQLESWLAGELDQGEAMRATSHTEDQRELRNPICSMLRDCSKRRIDWHYWIMNENAKRYEYEVTHYTQSYNGWHYNDDTTVSKRQPLKSMQMSSFELLVLKILTRQLIREFDADELIKDNCQTIRLDDLDGVEIEITFSPQSPEQEQPYLEVTYQLSDIESETDYYRVNENIVLVVTLELSDTESIFPTPEEFSPVEALHALMDTIIYKGYEN